MRQVSDQPRGIRGLTSFTTRYVITPNETDANRTMLFIGTEARAGWLTCTLSSFHAHHFSCGPSWSKTS